MRLLPNIMIFGIVALICGGGYYLFTIHSPIIPDVVYNSLSQTETSSQSKAKAPAVPAPKSPSKTIHARRGSQVEASVFPAIAVTAQVISQPLGLPGKTSTLVGLTKSELRASYGDPELSTAQRDQGQMLETYFYLDGSSKVKAVRVKDGVVAEVHDAGPSGQRPIK